jgi:hypothetical protein
LLLGITLSANENQLMIHSEFFMVMGINLGSLEFMGCGNEIQIKFDLIIGVLNNVEGNF